MSPKLGAGCEDRMSSKEFTFKNVIYKAYQWETAGTNSTSWYSDNTAYVGGNGALRVEWFSDYKQNTTPVEPEDDVTDVDFS